MSGMIISGSAAVRPFVPAMFPMSLELPSHMKPDSLMVKASAPWNQLGREFIQAAQRRKRIVAPSEIELNYLPADNLIRTDDLRYKGDKHLAVTLGKIEDGKATGSIALWSMGRPDASMIVSGGKLYNLDFGLTDQLRKTDRLLEDAIKFHLGDFLKILAERGVPSKFLDRARGVKDIKREPKEEELAAATFEFKTEGTHFDLFVGFNERRWHHLWRRWDVLSYRFFWVIDEIGDSKAIDGAVTDRGIVNSCKGVWD